VEDVNADAVAKQRQAERKAKQEQRDEFMAQRWQRKEEMELAKELDAEVAAEAEALVDAELPPGFTEVKLKRKKGKPRTETESLTNFSYGFDG
jgi:hypothetical protein